MTVSKTLSPQQLSPMPSPESPPRKRKAESLSMDVKTEISPADIRSENDEISPAKKSKVSTKQPNAVRGRRKSRWKLKFHHQALPPEYLKHYKQQEKKRRMTESKKLVAEKSAKKPGKTADEESEPSTNLQEVKEDVMPSCEMPSSPTWPGLLSDSFPHLNIDLSQNKAFIENLLTNQIEINTVERNLKSPAKLKPVKLSKKPKMIPPSGKIMNYSDLPYMGEITLDGMKPRRGRKPKKADICHLIYKNYGQVFPGAPPNANVEEEFTKNLSKAQASLSRPIESPLPTVAGLLNHSEVQNRIINSLLEKRLTQKANENSGTCSKTSEEPLNLCLKDLQSLKIKLSRKHGNIYEAKVPQEDMVEIKKEIIDVESEESSTEDITPFSLVTTELRESDDEESVGFASLANNYSSDRTPEHLPSESNMFWPPSNYFYPPIAPEMYYGPTEKKPPKPVKIKGPTKRLIPKSNTATLARRKRSAIFIPPLPAENTTNPATEVSICKFKFTGGAKPSLQEKKMLSVDSGGNFRYYSGTGDKSMRGYEYFPRESLQQCQENTGCSPSGVFLTASALGSGEKIPEDIGHSGFFDSSFPLQLTPKIESSPKDKKRKISASTADPGESDSDSSTSTGANMGQSSGDLERRQARRSRKSLAREKLEQTFKEKGFLIQTQQLESAEGATYCKFRQLRKFTRYLFRSWKDYLPGNVRDLSENSDVLEPSAPPVKLEPDL